MDRQQALDLLMKYNKDHYHIRHALTVEAVMRWLAENEGYANEADFWAMVGLLHDIDFGMYPEQHLQKAPELLQEINAPQSMVRAICSHGYGLHEGCPKPEHHMEKLLFAVDELCGLVFAATLMRPSKSVQDMALKSLKKKFKDKAFAAGCSRDVISSGAEALGWPLDELMTKTLDAMRFSEEAVAKELEELTGSRPGEA